MGFFEKVKNMFTEEVEDDDVKVEQIKNEVTKIAIESPNLKKEEEKESNFEFKVEEKTPIFFDDNDFKDLNFGSEPKKEEKEIKKEPKKEEKEIYGSKIQTDRVVEKKAFKPTPIISPVYGVLDKNYHKEDIVARSDVRLEKETTESAIDAIRNKAYGTLEDELENTLFGSNSILFKNEEEVIVKEVDDDILTDLTDDISKELDELLIKKEKYIEEIEEAGNIDDIKAQTSIEDDDLLDFIDSTLYKEGEDE